MPEKPFWERKTLDQMSDEEWESLCDRCGRCCLVKLQDEDTEKVHFTRLSCRLLDTEACRCRHYRNRFEHVPDCLSVKPLTEEKVSWLPETCAYRLIFHGKPLYGWHPLISGSSNSVIASGISMAGRCISETEVPVADCEQYLIELDTGFD
ncbi:MAG: YcgN family cysteine cluster protein [Granulosicoccus sp.]|nr:YcgN family cysteine cluster protein [Granulosicoccus sp.]